MTQAQNPPNPPKVALIVAAGSGKRMNAPLPKQYLLLQNKPILMHTIEAFINADITTEIVVVINKNDAEYWQALCQKYDFALVHKVVFGGDERFFSVQNGINALNNLPKNTLVAIHDGVRPLASTQFINDCYTAAHTHQTAVPTLPLKDSIYNIQLRQNADRTAFNLVQTPQIFTLEILQKAYIQKFSPTFTDDASVVQAANYGVHLVPGYEQNIKITTPFDLAFAEFLLSESGM